MLLVLHVYEVHDDDASHISEPQLSCYLFGCVAVHFVSVFLLIIGLGPDTAIDIYHIESLCRFYYQICPLFYRNHLSERTLDLPRDIELVEQRLVAVIEFHDFFLVRGNLSDVLLDFLIFFLVIDIDVRERIIEKIAENRGGLAVLCKEQLDILGFGQLRP